MKNYVKEYKGHKVPEGAMYYGQDTEKYCEGWYMVDESSGKIKYQPIDGSRWDFGHYGMPDSAIELPEESDLDIKWGDAPECGCGNSWVWVIDNLSKHEPHWARKNDRGHIVAFGGVPTWGKRAEENGRITVCRRPEQPMPSKAEWLPEVGEWCECYVWTTTNGGEKRWISLPVIGHSKTSRSESCKGKAGIIIDSCEHDGKFIFCDEFRPLKTEEEKKREAIKEIVINSIDTSKFKVSEMGAIAEFLNQIVAKFDVIPVCD